jgi:hypothetical protein
MPHVETPWVGLAALGAMFVIPFLPSWLFEGPRTIRHRPRRHVCADCGAPWAPWHLCELDAPDEPEGRRPLRAQLRRIGSSRALEPRRRPVEKIGNS